jgi:hypothetical protein
MVSSRDIDRTITGNLHRLSKYGTPRIVSAVCRSACAKRTLTSACVQSIPWRQWSGRIKL